MKKNLAGKKSINCITQKIHESKENDFKDFLFKLK